MTTSTIVLPPDGLTLASAKLRWPKLGTMEATRNKSAIARAKESERYLLGSFDFTPERSTVVWAGHCVRIMHMVEEQAVWRAGWIIDQLDAVQVAVAFDGCAGDDAVGWFKIPKAWRSGTPSTAQKHPTRYWQVVSTSALQPLKRKFARHARNFRRAISQESTLVYYNEPANFPTYSELSRHACHACSWVVMLPEKIAARKLGRKALSPVKVLSNMLDHHLEKPLSFRLLAALELVIVKADVVLSAQHSANPKVWNKLRDKAIQLKVTGLRQHSEGNTRLGFGKHRWHTFAHVKANEPDYVAWALRQKGPSGALRTFVDYVRSEMAKDRAAAACEKARATHYVNSEMAKEDLESAKEELARVYLEKRDMANAPYLHQQGSGDEKSRVNVGMFGWGGDRVIKGVGY